MVKYIKISVIIFFTITLIFAPETANIARAQPSLTSKNSSILVTVQGTAQYEGASDNRGIKVEMWRDGAAKNTIGVVDKDVSGNYVFTNVDPAYSYSIVSAASDGGYSNDSLWITSTQLGASGGIFIASPLILLRPKQFNIDWVYQPDGSISFVSGSPNAGSVILISPTMKWISLGNNTSR